MSIERAEGQSAEPATPLAAALPGPSGIGTGVAFDWALTVQLLIGGGFFALGVGPGAMLAGQPLALRLAAGLVSVVFAAVVFTQGEALRRGRRVAWLIQMVANVLLILFGLTVLPGVVRSLGKGHIIGHIGELVEAIVLLVISPLIAWLLSRPHTRAWIGRTSSAEARARHGGSWLLWIALWAIIGGAAIAFVGYY